MQRFDRAQRSDDREMSGLAVVLRWWEVVRRHSWVVIVAVGLSIGVAALYLSQEVDFYQAEAIVEIRPVVPQVLNEMEPVVDPSVEIGWWFDQYYQTQYQILSSRAVAEEVVTNLQLANNLEFLGLDGNLAPEQLRQALASIDPVARLMSLTTIVPIEKSHLVRVRVIHTNPVIAAQLANEIAAVYSQRNERLLMQGTNHAFNWLETERDNLRRRLDQAEQSLMQYRETNGITAGTLADNHQLLVERLRLIDEQLVSVRTTLFQLRNASRQIRRARESGDLLASGLTDVVNSWLIQNLQDQLTGLQVEEAQLRTRYEDSHPDLRAVVDAMALVERSIGQEVERVLQIYQVQLENAQRTEEGLAQMRQEILDESLRLSQTEPVYEQLERDIEIAEQTLTLVERRYTETDLYRRQHQVNNIEVLQQAVVPQAPIGSDKTRALLLAAILGLFVGIGLAMLWEARDFRFRDQSDVEAHLGVPLLGMVPRMASSPGQGKAWEPFAPKSFCAVCLRGIHTALQLRSGGAAIRKILVTSSVPKEGKSFILINLGYTLARANKRVLLVESDLWRPNLYKQLGLSNQVGLTDVIAGRVDLEEAIQSVGIPNLDVLCCGPLPANPGEVLESPRFREIIENLAGRYDRILLDSPPLLPMSDAQILGDIADLIILVIRVASTERSQVDKSFGLLEQVKAPLAGVVLNGIDQKHRYYQDYYPYYYHYLEPELQPTGPNQTREMEPH